MNALEIGYVILTVIVTCLFLYGYNYALKRINVDTKSKRKRLTLLILGIVSWWAYVFLLAASGFLKELSLPPRFPLLLIIPLFIFTAILLYKKRNSAVLHAIPRSWPIYFQSFRIVVESLFIATVSAGILHKEVTLEGYNYDMFIGLTAPIIALLVYQLRIAPQQLALVWNYLGLLVLASVIALFTTTVFFPSLWGYEGVFVPTEFLDFPYILVAAYLMPMAVFVHIVSIIQLTGSKEFHIQSENQD